MFNGIIEVVGAIRRIMPSGDGGARLEVHAGRFATQLHPGDSLAVDGICLTVVKKKGAHVAIDVSAETWRLTNLCERKPGSRVNLEMPLTASTLVSGHFVQGHVEGVAKVLPWKIQGEDVRLCLRIPQKLVEACIPKGSIALNGVSLTIATLRSSRIEVALIPYTLSHTNLGDLQPGQGINVETDMIGRYVVSLVKKAYSC
ncbi:MAG TPA: riboflavin synthase [Acidobacteriota bacterium]|nr:riboflavin synthase [Acidobacteriota bacterium]